MNTSADELLRAVQASRLAQGLSAEQVSVLASRLKLQRVAAGEVLAGEGSSDNRLYVVAAGTLHVVKHAASPDEALLMTLSAGDFAHELGFLDGSERYASLRAATDAQVLVLEREQLESLIDAHPRILFALMCTIVRTVHQVQTRLSMQAAELTNYIVKQHGRY